MLLEPILMITLYKSHNRNKYYDFHKQMTHKTTKCRELNKSTQQIR